MTVSEMTQQDEMVRLAKQGRCVLYCVEVFKRDEVRPKGQGYDFGPSYEWFIGTSRADTSARLRKYPAKTYGCFIIQRDVRKTAFDYEFPGRLLDREYFDD